MYDLTEKSGILTEYRFERDFALFQKALPLVQSRRLAIDCGAHKGMWTQFMASEFERVFAIEPHPDHYADLVRRVRELQPGSRVDTLNGAVGAGTFAGTVESHGDNDGQLHVIADSRAGDGPKCYGYSLDSLAVTKGVGLYEPGLVKIDVEGMELEVLAGGHQLIQCYRPVLVIEFEQCLLQRYGTSVEEVARVLDSWGYHHVDTSHHDTLWIPHAP